MKDVVYLVPPGKIICYITQLSRNDTPEENVRQRWARSLVDEYGYDRDDIELEFNIQVGTARKRADIVIFKPRSKHIQENAIIIVEAKRDDILSTDKSKGEGHLKNYMAACPSCRFGLWVGKQRIVYERTDRGEISPTADIPRAGDEKPRRPVRKDLLKSQDLTNVFRRCHNYIHANGGWQKGEAFHEMLKLIFCKVYDEEEGSGADLSFAIEPKEQRSESGKRKLLEDRLKPLFEKVKSRYPYIFKAEEQIKLDPTVLAYIVAELQFISLLETQMDVKGSAYEELVGENLRGDRGEYFTPRNVCDMTVKMIQMYLGKNVNTATVLDCCCGTGGFIVSWIDNLRNIIRLQEQQRHTKNVEAKVKERIRQACSRYLYALDINPFLVQTAQMNLVMHGDGSTNVFREDSTKSPGEWSDDSRKKIPYGSVDVVITNPPFGGEVKIDDPHVLSRYELTTWDATNPRTSMPAEQLFMEAALGFLKPGGILGIVIPDGILNNPGLRFIRSWTLNRATLIASVDLPKETFAANGGVNNPSVLILRKLTNEEIRLVSRGDYHNPGNAFMSKPKTCGIDKRGKHIFLRHPDGLEMLNNRGERILDDEVSLVPESFRQFLDEQE
jgi:type I restriction enzyme M protein